MTWRDVVGHPARLAHDQWLERGRTGDGRLAVTDKELSGAQLSGARLVAARFERCTFDRAVIEMGDLDEIELVDCRGAEGSLSRNRLYKATITGCTFTNMRMWRLRLVNARVERSLLTRCMLEEGFVVGSELVDTSLAGSTMRLVGFDRARLVRCDLRDVDLTGATAVGAHFEDCDLRGAVGAVLDGATLVNCRRD